MQSTTLGCDFSGKIIEQNWAFIIYYDHLTSKYKLTLNECDLLGKLSAKCFSVDRIRNFEISECVISFFHLFKFYYFKVIS